MIILGSQFSLDIFMMVNAAAQGLRSFSGPLQQHCYAASLLFSSASW